MTEFIKHVCKRLAEISAIDSIPVLNHKSIQQHASLSNRLCNVDVILNWAKQIYPKFSYILLDIDPLHHKLRRIQYTDRTSSNDEVTLEDRKGNVPVQAIMAWRGSESRTPLFLNLDTIRK